MKRDPGKSTVRAARETRPPHPAAAREGRADEAVRRGFSLSGHVGPALLVALVTQAAGGESRSRVCFLNKRRVPGSAPPFLCGPGAGQMPARTGFPPGRRPSGLSGPVQPRSSVGCVQPVADGAGRPCRSCPPGDVAVQPAVCRCGRPLPRRPEGDREAGVRLLVRRWAREGAGGASARGGQRVGIGRPGAELRGRAAQGAPAKPRGPSLCPPTQPQRCRGLFLLRRRTPIPCQQQSEQPVYGGWSCCPQGAPPASA